MAHGRPSGSSGFSGRSRRHRPFSPLSCQRATHPGCSIKLDGFAAWAARGASAIEDARANLGDSQTSAEEVCSTYFVAFADRGDQLLRRLWCMQSIPTRSPASCPRHNPTSPPSKLSSKRPGRPAISPSSEPPDRLLASRYFLPASDDCIPCREFRRSLAIEDIYEG